MNTSLLYLSGLWCIWITLIATGYVVILYGIAPILIKFAQSLRMSPAMLEASISELPAGASASLLTMARALGDLGFEVAAYVRIPDQVPGSTAYLALLVNRETRDIATWSCAQTALFTDMMPSFTTRFDDGFDVVTRSWNQLGMFPHPPHEERQNFPQIRDVRQLCRVHRLRAQRSRHASRERIIPDEQGVLEFIRVDTDREYEWLVESGYYWPEQSSQRFRPTWKGAYLMTWKMLFPVKQVRRWLIWHQAAVLLRELDSESPHANETRA